MMQSRARSHSAEASTVGDIRETGSRLARSLSAAAPSGRGPPYLGRLDLATRVAASVRFLVARPVVRAAASHLHSVRRIRSRSACSDRWHQSERAGWAR
jgi:hypothetical protein